MIYVVGIGPGKKDYMTFEAVATIVRCDVVVVGYRTYIDLIRDLLDGKILVENGMRQEIDRARAALDLSKKGHNVAVISGGDSGVYGMAGLVYELNSREEWNQDIRIIQGVTSSISAAAQLGAPLMNDFCHISLSDLMTPMDQIEKRIRLAAQADFVICLYNPKSKGRPGHLRLAFDIMREYKSKDTPVGIVKNAGRDNMEKYVMTFENMDYDICDMSTMVIIGNKESYIERDTIITSRGYSI